MNIIREFISDYQIARCARLDKEESWTAVRRYIARTFLLAGVILGCPMGISVALAIVGIIRLLSQ